MRNLEENFINIFGSKVEGDFYEALYFIEESEIIRGFSKGDKWNGWACPCFTLEEAHKVVKLYGENFGFYNANLDMFVFSSYNDEEVVEKLKKDLVNEDLEDFEKMEYSGDIEVFRPQIIEVGEKEIKVYPIGAYSWTWDEVKKNH